MLLSVEHLAWAVSSSDLYSCLGRRAYDPKWIHTRVPAQSCLTLDLRKVVAYPVSLEFFTCEM